MKSEQKKDQEVKKDQTTSTKRPAVTIKDKPSDRVAKIAARCN